MKPALGVFCLEGDWDPDLRRQGSVEPILQMLASVGLAEYVHRNVATIDQFTYYLQRWSLKKYDSFGLLYLPAHGSGNELHLGKDSVSLDHIGEVLEGKARGRVIHFGGCDTLDIDDEVLRSFAKRTGASAVTGYRATVDWLEAATLEAVLLERLSRGKRTDAFYNHLAKDYGPLVERLKLVIATPRKVYGAQKGRPRSS